nr:tetratricopeptide repeat protein [Jiangella mangrovi]
MLRAVALSGQQRWAEVIEVIREGFALHGPVGVYFPIIGDALRKLGRLQEAESAYLEGLRHWPNDADLLLGYARVCVDAGQADKAAALADRAAAQNPEHPLLDKDRATIAFAQGKHTEMHRHTTQALAGDPDDVAARALHGAAAHSTGDHDAAYRSLARAAANEPGNAPLLEAAREARMIRHPLMRPLTVFGTVNPLALWLGAILVIGVLNAAAPQPAGFVAAIVWLVFCVYSWVVPPVLRRWLDWRARR